MSVHSYGGGSRKVDAEEEEGDGLDGLSEILGSEDALDTGFARNTEIDHQVALKRPATVSRKPGERVSAFLAQNSHITPAASPDPDQYGDYREASQWHIPESYVKHWGRVPEIIKTIPINMTPVPGVCMTPTLQHEGKMFGESKSFSLMRAASLDHLASPHSGMTYCFVSECLSEIPSVSLKTLFFFDNCRKILQTQDRGPYVFPTNKIGLLICRKNKKTVTGLYAKGERSPEEMPHTPSDQQEDEFISVKKMLDDRAQEQPEETRSPLNEIRINLGFTGAEFKDSDGKIQHKNFCVVMVTPVSNFSMWPYIHEVLLAPPKMGAMQYQHQLELHTSMKSALEEILNFEMVVNLGVLQQDFGISDNYRFNSGGSLGVMAMLSPFSLPQRIFNVIKTQHNNPSEIRIIGMPKLTFKERCPQTTGWIAAYHRNVNANQRIEERGAEILQKYNMLKDKSTFDDTEQESTGGWPLEVASDGSQKVLVFGLPNLPLKLMFNSHGTGVKNYDVWFSSIGGGDSLPQIVRALLRAYLVETNTGDQFPGISHFLHDSRTADPVLLFNTYFSASVDPFKALMIVNSQKVWWEGFVKDMRHRRETGTTVEDSVKSFEKYIMGVICNLHANVDGGGFRSKTISQIRFIVETLNFGEVCVLSAHSISKRMASKSAKISSHRKYDRVYRGWNAFMNTFTEINRSFYLNSANLVCVLEIMISQLLHKFGGLNDTWTYFFTTLLVMSGNGHFLMMGEKGPVPDRRKPNNTGADNAVLRTGDLDNGLYEIIGVPDKDRYLLMLNCTRFTKTVWEQISTATAAGNELLTQPTSDLNDRPMAITELRGGDSFEPIIMQVAPRGDAQSQAMALNSCDPDRNGVRRLAEKMKVSQACVELICTNTPDITEVAAEHTKTLLVVSPVIPPGSGMPCHKRSRQQFQDIGRDVNTGRHREIEDKESVVYFLKYTHVFASLYGGLINRGRGIPFEINQPTAALIEWATFYLQEYGKGVINSVVRESFSRMVQGYTTRAIAWYLWIQTMDHLSRAKDFEHKEETIRPLLMDLFADVMPIVGVPSMLTCLMSRAVDMSSLLMTMVIAENLAIPVISWKGLNQFFDDAQPPTEEGLYMDEYVMIRKFFVDCLEARRFCPGNEEGSWDPLNNISCYITGEGREGLTPLYENSGFLRFTHSKDKNGDENMLFSKMANRFQKMKGRDMFKVCHMGPERVCYKLAFEGLQRYMPDFRGMSSHNTYCYAKHFKKMDLLQFLPGLTDYTDVEPLPFARHVYFKEGEHVKSEGLGINPFSMLTIVALAGEILVHPSISGSFSMGLVTQVLSRAPPNATPGGICTTREFDPNSKPMRLFIPMENKSEHFLRPDDNTFATTGVLPLARAMGRFLPEDFLHCTSLYQLANTFKCDILEVPAAAIKSAYNLIPNKCYPYHVPGKSQDFGYVTVHTESEKVEFIEKSRDDPNGGSVHILTFFDWEEYISANGYVLPPLIERGGACILVDIGTPAEPNQVVGCLLKDPVTGSQLDPESGTYRALVKSDNSMAQVFFKDVLTSLLGVGTIMYLQMEVIEDERFNHASRQGKYLFTRLNVPNVSDPVQGKIYVTGVCRKNRTRTQVASVSSVTFPVNPWDVIPKHMFKGDPSAIVKNLD